MVVAEGVAHHEGKATAAQLGQDIGEGRGISRPEHEAVHLADALVCDMMRRPGAVPTECALDETFLAIDGVARKVARWREKASAEWAQKSA